MEPSTTTEPTISSSLRKGSTVVLAIGCLLLPETVKAGEKWDLNISPGVPSGTALINEPATYRVHIQNPGSTEQRGKVILSRIPPDGTAIQEERKLVMAPGKISSVEFRLDTERPSYEVLKAELWINDACVAEAESGLLVVEKPATYEMYAPQSFFGSMFIKDEEAARRIGIKCIRTGADWARIEPEPGKYNWERLDTQIDTARAHKMGVVLVLRPETTPKHTAWRNLEQLSQSEHIGEFAHFIELVLQRYKDRICAVEVINEPDLDCAHNLSAEGASTTVYARLLKVAYEQIRKVAPDLPILGLGVSGVDFPHLPFSRQVLKEQPGFLDIMSGHPYSYARYVGASYRPESPLKLNTKARISAMAELMKQTGLTPRIWITEFGWALDRREKASSPAAYLHAAFAAQAITLSRAVPELEKLFWFSMMFPGLENGSSYGMYRGDAAKDKIFFPLPAAAAYATCARQLEQAESVKDFMIAEILHVERFRKGDQALFVLWMKDAEGGGGSAQMKLTEEVSTIQAVSALGLPVELKGVAAKITAMPVFLSVPLEQGDAMEKALQTAEVQASDPLVVRNVHLVGEKAARVEILNNYGRPLSVKIFESGDINHAQSRKLVPGLNRVPITVGAREQKEGEIRVTLLDEISKETLEGKGSYHLIDLPSLPDGTMVNTRKHLDDLPSLTLNQRDNVLPADPGVDWKGAADLSAVVQTGWTNEGWMIQVKVEDDIHVGPVSSENPWAYDSLQIVFDADQKNDDNLGEGCLELSIALGETGALVMQTFPSGGPVDLPVDVDRKATLTTYRALIPWEKLGREKAPVGEVMRMNLIVNDNDGQKRKCWIGITPGIGESKTPGIYKQWLIKP